MQVFAISLACCVLLILLLRGVAHSFGVVDHPGGRKRHAHSTPAIGGLAMFTAVLLAMLWTDGLGGKTGVLMGCAAALVALGVLDDRHGLSVSLRMMIEVFIVSVVIIGAEGTVVRLGALAGSDIQLGMFAIPFSIVAFVGGINAVNMIDGADGMAGMMALLTLLGAAFILSLSGAAGLLPLALAMLGALAGFLLFNMRLFVGRAWVFMGNAGSMWLGLALGWFMAQVATGEVAAEPALVLWLFGIPLIDTLAVLLRRQRRNNSLFAADRTHIHHVLEHAGFSVRRMVWVLSMAQAALVGMGVIFYLMHASAAVIFWSFVLLFAVYYYQLRNH